MQYLRSNKDIVELVEVDVGNGTFVKIDTIEVPSSIKDARFKVLG